MARSPSLFSLAPLKKMKRKRASRAWNYPLRCFWLRALSAPISESRVSLLDFTLAWLKLLPSRWKSFVANRVSAVQLLLPGDSWRYVTTHTNPADCASRGLASDLFEKHALWWSGLLWLHHSPESNSCPSVSSDVPLENPEPPVYMCIARYAQLRSCVALFFVIKIDYEPPLTVF